ncbi:saccharopine dehydrogenase NADP-binding domain-containing protein [Verrucosispora sp. WMMC514]|uniref:saccharopine dehydrogenase NADP-binding domain-containing protein n=1 Tax=Verrucosispora sp. WMMC514 TaxID=3015156 RepID=UPI00248B4D9A|nr:saccharopine dehydrogenase NADP-binding domain-containing protein [Verrucosispora sp. WMMC514]WBB94073.1 saccharopine dehydrogenase NADP-binding domain-containing protein [Verrucosispora sp. WMMC514]
MTSPVVGVLGCYGAVGSAVVELLAAADVRLRLGGRRPGPLTEVARETGVPREATAIVDAADRYRLAEFAAGCAVVVDCTAPAYRAEAGVVRAAVAAGADYVGAAGEHRYPGLPTGRRVVVGAGMTPGLTFVLPRALAAAGFDRLDRLTAYTGGRDRFTPGAARDYVAGMVGGAGRSLAAWRGGRRVPGALTPLDRVELPYFPGRVTAHPFLSTEAERLAATLGLAEVSWYHVFDGEQALRALSTADPADIDPAADRLVRAAELETFGRSTYQLIVLQLDGAAQGRPVTRTLALRAADSYRLTAEAAVLAVRAVLAGEVPPGSHHAGEVLDPARVMERLAAAPSVRQLEVVDRPAAVEEGAL